MQWKLIVILALVILVSVFAVLNTEPVSVNLLLARQQVPLVLLIFGCAAIGALAGALLGMGESLGRRRKIAELTNQVSQQENELTGLRALVKKLEQAQSETGQPE